MAISLGGITKATADGSYAALSQMVGVQPPARPLRHRATIAGTVTVRPFTPGEREWGVIRNDHATNSIKVGYSNNGVENYNAPTLTVTVAPGQEYVESGNERAVFVGPSVGGNAIAVTVECGKRGV